jgi:hypothetical protein
MFMGFSASAVMLWMMAHRSAPDSPEDFGEAFFMSVLDMIPFFGPVLSSQIRGYEARHPLGGTVKFGRRLFALPEKVINGTATEKDYIETMSDLLESGFTAYGLPYQTLRSYFKAYENKDPLLPILGSGESK